MTPFEQYEFDRLGYLIIKGILALQQVQSLSHAIDEVEEHALANLHLPPRVASPWQKNHEYHRSEERGYHAWGSNDKGATLICNHAVESNCYS